MVLSVVQKTFKCIEAIARLPEGLTVSETAAITGLSRPATNRLLDDLAQDNIVFRDSKSKRYRLGPRLYQWANVAMQAGTPVNIARKEIISLCLDMDTECNFLVLNDLDTVIVERCTLMDGVPVNRPLQAPSRIWYQTGTGKVVVAYSSPEARQSVLERTYKRPDLNPPPRKNLEAQLEQAKSRGFVATPDPRNPAQTGIVVPIFDSSGYAVAAIGSYMNADDLENESGMTLVAKMTATAGRISHYLGFEERHEEGSS
jgi:IclR family transcriptional regulator, pca regulon regulatory protein